ncbi:MAG: C25 family cysteine peptidase [Bacteroidetes bacterium]|nr:C25 family cysteine peptidase [Bacteroidota bacterium]
MKNFLLTSILVLSCLLVKAQPYNNEWINYNQTYYKFKIGATGIYRISQPTLTTMGIAATPVERFQLWRNGKEVPLYTTIQTGVMTGTDYIEFWGEMNDGKPDKELYRIPDHQLNDKWSLETDTVSFFLTITPAGGNKRLVPTLNNLPSSLTPEPYFVHTVGKYYKEKMNSGYAAIVGEYVYSSAYDQGEGWTTSDFGINVTRSDYYDALNPYTGPGASAPVLKTNIVGNALNPRDVQIKLNGTEVQVVPLNFFDYAKVEVPLTISQISSGNAVIDIKNIGLSPNDRMVIAQTELIYPRTFNLGGVNNFMFELPASGTNGNYLEITNFNYGSVSPVLYDLTNGKRYICDISAAPVIKMALQASTVARKLLLVTQANGFARDVTTLQTRNFVNYALPANQGNYLIISHPALTTAAGGANPVEDYRAYRSSAVGGSHTAKIYMVDDLIDQFGYGIKKNPNGLRNFIRWARNTYSSPVKNVLLVGKGLNYQQYNANESHPDVEKLSFIPTFGVPASDNLLAADPGPDEIPKVSIGRISAINGDEVAIYLAKLKQYDAQQAFSSPLIADKAWTKNVVHVVGASDGSLGAILQADMENYKSIISDTLYGANVNTFSKVSSAPVEPNASERLYHLFEEGIGLMTYFGHSSASSLEFNLDNPDNYNNQGKYPVTITLGCNAGNFYNFNPLRFVLKETLSEKFVLANQRGSIAFVASTHFGIVHYLDIFNTRTYIGASTTQYGKTLGELMRESITQTYNLTTQNDYYARFHCEQTTIHGDPAIRLDVMGDKPDYAIEAPYLKVSPSFISVAETSFKVDAKMFNLSKAIDKKIVVELRRTYPDLTTEVIRRDTIRGIRYMDSLSYNIPIVATRDKGLNKISICIDADNAVDELYETNNCVTKDVFIYEDEARPVFPYNYAIVNKQNIKLVASTANPFSLVKQYTMEMDTTELFNSPAKITRTISSPGGVLEFNPGITFTDSTVYYWRVSPVPTSGSPVWNGSSFVYLNPSTFGTNNTGYNQSHFYQHNKSKNEKMTYNPANRRWEYGQVPQNLFIQMGTWITSGATTPTSLSISINGVPHIRLTCWFSTLVFNVFDPISFRPWVNRTVVPHTFPTTLGQGLYGSTDNNCFDEPRYYNFEYRYTDTASRRKMMNLMRDTIPDGHYVVVRNFTLINAFGFPRAWAEDWKNDQNYWGAGQSLYHYLKNAGFSGIDSFYKARPWVLVYKKNDPSFTPQWLVGRDSIDNPTLSINLNTTDTVAYMTSPVFGPSKGWKQLIWRGTGDPIGDTATVDVIGQRIDGSEQVLFTRITTAQQNFDVSTISATEFPYVKLKLRTADNTNYTPYQLRYWRLTYDPAPEGAIAPNIYLKTKDTVEVGEPMDFRVAFKNVSQVPFDSLKVKMVITDQNNVPHIVPIPKRRPLLTEVNAPSDTLHLGATVNTNALAGHNTLYIEANPDNDQVEQYHFNNFAYRNLYVKPDSLNPLLDVTFDGVHILNRDIVSSKPDILIKLKDEARWLSLDDTTLLTLQIRYPNGSLKRFYFNNTDTVRFTPAGQAPVNDNTASINLRPFLAQDGEYELIVTGRDKSNNAAGAIEYKVVFEVINKPMISNMLNYPNPFTTSTAFVFTVTGSEVPQNIKIEIMTVTGKIVREITKDELGPLHIGRNITDFKWDGTDQYGQKLANGIYLYRVVTNLNGKSLDKYKATGDNTDKYFNKGYGKMYLMR